MGIYEALKAPLDEAALLGVVPELELSKGLEQGPFHHLDVYGHTLEVVHGVEREFKERKTGAIIRQERMDALRLVGLLHDIAKPLTRAEYEGKVMFVAHDTLGARLAYRICQRLDVSAETTDIVTSLTTLHLKIGFMGNERSDYPPQRLARAAGPFGEELAVLSWADRLAARGPRLKQEHIDRHQELCDEFLSVSRQYGPYPVPDYESLIGDKTGANPEADAGYTAGRLRLTASRDAG